MHIQGNEEEKCPAIRLVKENLKKSLCHKTLEERAAEFDGKLRLNGEYDWGEPVGREIW